MRWTWLGIAIGILMLAGLLIGFTIGLGVAIQRHVIVPPELDLRTGAFRILAVVVSPTHAAMAVGPSPCAPQREGYCAPRQEFYLVWMLAEAGAIESGRQISTRVLTLPLRCT
jgi:hypothetical protein